MIQVMKLIEGTEKMKEYACDKLNSLLDETYKTIAEKEISKVNRNSHLNLTNSELHFIEAIAQCCSENKEKTGDYSCTITQVAERQSITLPSCTVAAKKLERKGYVEKTKAAEDKRETRVKLTRQGEKINTVHLYIHHRISREVSKYFTQEEQEIIIRGLEKINEFFKKELYTGDRLTGKEE